MKIFITGGAGFIGSNLIKTLLEKQIYKLTIYDNLSTTNCDIENIRKYIDNKDIHFINGDILNEKLLIESMVDHDIVIHLAAQLEVTVSYNNPIHDLNVNLIGTINVINACVKNKINRLINASSGCVYGFTDGKSSNENDNTNPNWEYGISKLASEKYIQIAHNTHNINYTSLRFSIVYGKNEWYGRVLTIFIKRALENKDIVIFGDGNQIRDYINVTDVCDFIYECIINTNTYNKIYNVSTNNGVTINELAKKIKELFPNINIVYENINEGEVSKLIEGRVRLNQELKYLVLNNSYALNTTNWYPKISFENGLVEYINWIKNNLNYWKVYKV
jgi:UDP-glucose 4-epimerase